MTYPPHDNSGAPHYMEPPTAPIAPSSTSAVPYEPPAMDFIYAKPRETYHGAESGRIVGDIVRTTLEMWPDQREQVRRYEAVLRHIDNVRHEPREGDVEGAYQRLVNRLLVLCDLARDTLKGR